MNRSDHIMFNRFNSFDIQIDTILNVYYHQRFDKIEKLLQPLQSNLVYAFKNIYIFF